jgi:diguanylate cyclase (GGDEF)-like protein
VGNLPKAARCYVRLVLALGTAGLLGMLLVAEAPWSSCLIAAMIAAAGLATQKLVLVSSPPGESSRAHRMSTLSLGFPVVFGSLLWFGAAGGALVGVASAVGGSLYPRRKSLYQLWFNAVSVGLTAYASGWLMAHLTLSPPPMLAPEPLSLLAGALVYYLLNTAIVSTAVALSRHESPWLLWREVYSWTAPSFLLGVVLVVTSQSLYRTCGPLVTGLSILCLYLVHHSYRTYFEKANRLAESEQRLEQVCLAVVKSMAQAIDARDSAASDPVHRAQTIAVALAEKMGLGGAELQAIRVAGLTYDVGKLAVPDTILWKAGPLTPEEFERVKTHVEIGVSILEPVQFPWPVVEAVRTHHERWDGKGYPSGLKGEEIPMGGRIVAIADVYDALTSRRPYRQAMTGEEALEVIRAGSGTQFDPLLVEALVEIFPTLLPALDEAPAEDGDGPPLDSRPARAARVWNEIQQATLQSRSLAFVDALTGLGNARHLEASLSRELEIGWRLGRPCSVLVMDLDGFKAINDTFGHLAGDFALQWVAQVMDSELREGATLCRKGGDEFVAILPGTRRDQAEQVAERLGVRVSEYLVSDISLRLGLSVGVATFPDDARDPAVLQDVADRNMYAQKARRKTDSAEALRR